MVGIMSRDMAMSIASPALSTLFIVRVPFITTLVEVVAEQVTATVPKIPSTPRTSNGSNTYFPGVEDVDGISITFYETEDYAVSNWLMKWRKLVYDNDTGFYGLPKDYYKPIYVDAYSTSSTSPIRSLQYIDCWPTDQGPYEYNYAEETGRITVAAQFSVNDMKV